MSRWRSFLEMSSVMLRSPRFFLDFARPGPLYFLDHLVLR